MDICLIMFCFYYHVNLRTSTYSGYQHDTSQMKVAVLSVLKQDANEKHIMAQRKVISPNLTKKKSIKVQRVQKKINHHRIRNLGTNFAFEKFKYFKLRCRSIPAKPTCIKKEKDIPDCLKFRRNFINTLDFPFPFI